MFEDKKTNSPQSKTALERPRIHVDSREAANRNGKKIIELLEEAGAKTIVTKLDFGDYLLDDDIVIERKTVFDLANTLTQRYLFEQLLKMKEAYPRSILLIEGYMGMLRKYRKLSPEALCGTLFNLAQANISLIPTIDFRDTATFLVTSAKQLLKNQSGAPVIRHKKKAKNTQEQQLFVVTGLPKIGPTLGDSLLRRFKTVRAVFSAQNSELMEVKGIGSETVKGIMQVLDKQYEGTRKKKKS